MEQISEEENDTKVQLARSKLDTLQKTIDIANNGLGELENAKGFTRDPLVKKLQAAAASMDFGAWKLRLERRNNRNMGDGGVITVGGGGTLTYRGGIKSNVQVHVVPDDSEDRGALSETLSEKEDTTRRNEEHSIWQMRLILFNTVIAAASGSLLLPKAAGELIEHPLNAVTMYICIATAGIIYSQLTYLSIKAAYMI